MTVAATTNTTTAPTTATSSSSTDSVSAAKDSLATNFNMFLTLLTAQMQNQDPLSPIDNTQFTQQLVAMTGVEQQINTNQMLQQLVANSGTNVASAVDLIGKNVRADTAEAQLTNGSAQWSYNLPSDTPNLKIEVLDSSGNTVDVIAPTSDQTGAGDHTLSWNGQNLAGQTLPDGVYTLQLTTQTDSGDTAVGTIYQEGTASAVEQSNGATLITINGSQIPLSQISSVTPAAATTPTANPVASAIRSVVSTITGT